ncbi:beta family protein [Clostridium tertium]|jgi:hypothetical protein|uniref:beta family protein n=1 Tax=Clostridium tertium TaxID=1559 RepID=UPI000DD04F77|nr:hypothetical protein [Clostridium tertium]MDB1939205.1 hypothetical protein [Clostridium tertium]MDU8967456.1 hypothetical protein [Clostridium sp.]
MKYIPSLYSLDAELISLKKQSFSNNIIPLVNIVKDKKSSKSSKSILDDLEDIIKSKPSNQFFINVPMNLVLSKKKLKNPIEAFYKDIKLNSLYQISILKRFSKLSNVIPVIDVDASSYRNGDLKKIYSHLNVSKVAYIYSSKKSDCIMKELSNLITSNDILIYDLNTNDLFKNSIKSEIAKINAIKSTINFKSIVIKQIYDDLTFSKLPNREITPSDSAYDCIDSDFINDFSNFKFNYFGDHCGIRNLPIYKGGQSYPSFIGLHPSKFIHFGFIGKEQDVNSHSSTLLPNIQSSDYWNKILTPTLKKTSYGCEQINSFISLTIPKGKSNPINNGTTWKSIIISHYISIIDNYLKHNIVP